METNRIQQNPTKASPETGLTPIQEQAAILLASGESITSVSEKLNLNRSTIYQWQQKVTFRCFFNFQKQEIKNNLLNGLFGLYKEALESVKMCLTSDNEATRLKTAMWIIGKIEDSDVGGTDAKEILKEEATRIENAFSDWNAERKVFDEKKYKKLLAENGLK